MLAAGYAYYIDGARRCAITRLLLMLLLPRVIAIAGD